MDYVRYRSRIRDFPVTDPSAVVRVSVSATEDRHGLAHDRRLGTA
jgi:hypothetical protein